MILPRTIFIRALACLAVVAAAAKIVAVAAVPGGIISASTDLIAPARFVTLPKPSDRLDVTGHDAVLTGTPVYLDVTPPSAFDEITMTVRYANPSRLAVEVGALASTIDSSFDVRLGDVPSLDALPWATITDGHSTLYSRSSRQGFSSIADFLSRSPAAGVATLGTRLPAPRQNAASLETPRTTTISLRGTHTLLVAGSGHPLSFTFTVQDMNRQTGADPVVVSLYREAEDEVLGRVTLDDDGSKSDDQHSSPLRSVRLAATPSSPVGAFYRIEFVASDDVFIRAITTPETKYVFDRHLYLGDFIGYSDAVTPVTVFTDGRRLAAETDHVEGIQTLDAAGSPLAVASIGVRSTISFAYRGTHRITSPRRDVVLETDGVFALSSEAMFAPERRRLPLGGPAAAVPPDLSHIFAAYVQPREQDGDRIIEQVFSTSRLGKTKTGAYRFAIVAPDIATAPSGLIIKKITFTFRRQPIPWTDSLRAFLDSLRPGSPTVVIPTDGVVFGETVE